jgi:adenine deaminase
MKVKVPGISLSIRGVILINGTGAPPIGPVDIVIEKNRIKQIVNLGFPDIAVDPKKRPQLAAGGKELNAEGMYLLPGFIDMHGHIGGMEQELLPNMFLNYGWHMALQRSVIHLQVMDWNGCWMKNKKVTRI